jgi:hypothetical protein
MALLALKEVPDQRDTHVELLLRAAKEAKDALKNGGVDLTNMTREERRKALFGNG